LSYLPSPPQRATMKVAPTDADGLFLRVMPIGVPLRSPSRLLHAGLGLHAPLFNGGEEGRMVTFGLVSIRLGE